MKQLDEGIIKVPKGVLIRVVMKIQDIFAQSLYDIIMPIVPPQNRNVLISNLKFLAAYQNGSVDGVDLLKNSNDAVVYYITNSKDIFDYDTDSIKPLYCGAIIDSSKRQYRAYYKEQKDNDIILYNLSNDHSVKSITSTIESMCSVLKSDDEDTLEDFDLFFSDSVFDGLNEQFKKFSRDLKNAMEHEIAHYIQHNFFGKKDPSQIDMDNDYENDLESYYTSNVEYSPQLITVISKIKNYLDDLKKKDTALTVKEFNILMKVFLYLNNDSDEEEKEKLFSKIPSLGSHQISGVSGIINIIGRKSPEKRKIGIKYIYDETYRYAVDRKIIKGKTK